eukprot:Skav202910  [mRNA]  locus=scaffold1565:60759:61067:+ [translate_table: standard]
MENQSRARLLRELNEAWPEAERLRAPRPPALGPRELQLAFGALGIELPNATEEQVKKSVRSLALHCHPDKNPGNPEMTERFRRLSAAYEKCCEWFQGQRGIL